MTARGKAKGAKSGGLPAVGRELADLVVEYAKQETFGPLKSLGRFLAFGVAGSIALAIGSVLLALAVLRVLQEETGSTFTGHLSWLPYCITAAAATVAAGLTATRIAKGPARRRPARAGRKAV